MKGMNTSSRTPHPHAGISLSGGVGKESIVQGWKSAVVAGICVSRQGVCAHNGLRKGGADCCVKGEGRRRGLPYVLLQLMSLLLLCCSAAAVAALQQLLQLLLLLQSAAAAAAAVAAIAVAAVALLRTVAAGGGRAVRGRGDRWRALWVSKAGESRQQRGFAAGLRKTEGQGAACARCWRRQSRGGTVRGLLVRCSRWRGAIRRC